MQVTRSGSRARCNKTIYERDTLESGRSIICVGCSKIYHKNCADQLCTELDNVFECCVNHNVDLIGYDIAPDPHKSDIDIVKSDLRKIYNINLDAISVRRFAVLSPRCKYLPLIIHFSYNEDLKLVWKFQMRLSIFIGKVRRNEKVADVKAKYLAEKEIYDRFFRHIRFGPLELLSIIPKRPPLMSDETKYPVMPPSNSEFNGRKFAFN